MLGSDPVLGAGGHRIRQAGELGAKAEVFADAAAVEEGVEGARGVGVRTVRRRRPHGGEQGSEVGGLVVDHVIDAMRGDGASSRRATAWATSAWWPIDMRWVGEKPRIIGIASVMCASPSP